MTYLINVLLSAQPFLVAALVIAVLGFAVPRLFFYAVNYGHNTFSHTLQDYIDRGTHVLAGVVAVAGITFGLIASGNTTKLGSDGKAQAQQAIVQQLESPPTAGPIVDKSRSTAKSASDSKADFDEMVRYK
ncbi:hypothetical protein FDI24_gp212 [Acidovorax phage ACP17]|uniref:Uncharacterized protein n=1 Tax=Acidovorax phage ACP17 TaxID=2010329 RepID=A0A218M366_9CAUD|nr:hypothetical protein FDI24_gp212 [Acidovorax phage ACP17]ASD50493.1 hypothetical protein [Acidovorax phage ACP17]